MKKKTIIISIILCSLLIGSAIGGYIYYLLVYRTNHQPETELADTNTDAAIYKLDDLMIKLGDFGDVFDEEMKRKMMLEKEYGTYIIPGLNATKTIRSDNFQIDVCSSMTPQGLAVMEEYVFISAYCHPHEHNSVIYMLDKKSHKFIREIVLPDQSHVGGLAYDMKNKMLWISGYENKVAYTNAYTLRQMEEYNLESVRQALYYSQKAPLYTIKRNSFMTYNNEYLYAGYFTKKKNGIIQRYELEENGTLKIMNDKGLVNEKNFSTDDKFALPSAAAEISSKVQGMAFLDDYILLSQSYGIMKSVLMVFDNTSIEAKGYAFTEENALVMYQLPDKLEQIYVADGKVYMLFEAAAYAYRARPMTNIDRVISIDITDDIEAAKKEKDEKEELEKEKKKKELEDKEKTLEEKKKEGVTEEEILEDKEKEPTTEDKEAPPVEKTFDEAFDESLTDAISVMEEP